MLHKATEFTNLNIKRVWFSKDYNQMNQRQKRRRQENKPQQNLPETQENIIKLEHYSESMRKKIKKEPSLLE